MSNAYKTLITHKENEDPLDGGYSEKEIEKLIYHCPRCTGDWFYYAPPKWKYTATKKPQEQRACPQCKDKPIVQGTLEKFL